MAAGAEIFGDLMARRIAQPRQRHVRRVFAALGLEPEPLQEPLVLGLQLHQRRDRRGGGDQRARLAAAERRQPVEPQLERHAPAAAEHAGDFMRQRVIDVADETQRQVIILGIDPARARQAAAHHGKRLGDMRRNFESSEQAGHDDLLFGTNRRINTMR